MKLVEIGELGRIVTGKTPPTENKDYYDGVYPFITPTDIDSFDKKYLSYTERTLSDLGGEKIKNCKIPPKSICFVCIGSTIGKMCMTNCDSFTNQQINSIIPYNTCDSDYLFYLLRYINEYFRSIGAGTGSGKGIINKTTFSKTKIQIIEDKQKQGQIANILSTYDALIENNNKRIKLLEQMAENLYKEWFVRFRFPGYETAEFEDGIPKGWKPAKLRDIAKEVGKSIKKENLDGYNYYLPIDCLPNKSMHLNFADDINNAESSLHSFKKGDILFGAMRPYFHKVLRSPVDGVTRKTCFVINAKQQNYAEWLYLLLYQKSTIDFATTVSVGSTMPYVRWQDFSRMNIVLPDENTAKEFSNRVLDILNRINLFYFENENLTKQRDLLLPRLMSGKLEV